MHASNQKYGSVTMHASNQKYGSVAHKINDILKELNVVVVKYFNIIGKHLGNRGFHLNGYGAS